MIHKKSIIQRVCIQVTGILLLIVFGTECTIAQKKPLKPTVKKERSEYIRLSTVVFLRNMNTGFIENHFNSTVHQTADLPNGAVTIGFLGAFDINRSCIELAFSTKSLQPKMQFLRPQFNITSIGLNYGFYFNRNKMGTSKFLLGPDFLFYGYNLRDPLATGQYQYIVAQTFGAYLNIGYEFLFNFPVRANRMSPMLGLRIQYEHPMIGNNWGIRRKPGRSDLPGILEIGINCGFVK